MNATQFVPAAEAAFLAQLNDRQIHRLVDEQLVPSELLRQDDGARRLAPLACVFASFYFATEKTLIAEARKRCIWSAFERALPWPANNDESWKELLDKDWKFQASPGVLVDLLPFFMQVASRAQAVDTAEALVTTDVEVMGGMPCFAGTRVPISNVLGSLDEGMSFDDVKESYAFLTAAHVEAARVYAKVHPNRGRPRRRLDDTAGPKPHKRVVVRRNGNKLS